MNRAIAASRDLIPARDISASEEFYLRLTRTDDVRLRLDPDGEPRRVLVLLPVEDLVGAAERVRETGADVQVTGTQAQPAFRTHDPAGNQVSVLAEARGAQHRPEQEEEEN